jgi:hypothetical protein
MMVATPAKFGNKAEAGRSKAQHVPILTFSRKVGGIKSSEPVAAGLTGRIGKETGLISGIFAYNLTNNWPNGECRINNYDLYQSSKKLTHGLSKRDRI